MKRKLSFPPYFYIGIAVLTLLLLLLLLIWQFKKADIWSAIPVDAPIVIEINQSLPTAVWSNRANTEWNVIREALNIAPAKHLAVLQSNKGRQAPLNWLFVTALDQSFKSLLKERYSDIELEKDKYKKSYIYRIPNTNYLMAAHKKVLLVSQQRLQITYALESLYKNRSIPIQELETPATTRILVCPSRFPAFFRPFCTTETAPYLRAFRAISGWIALDDLKLENGLQLKGEWLGKPRIIPDSSTQNVETALALLPMETAIGYWQTFEKAQIEEQIGVVGIQDFLTGEAMLSLSQPLNSELDKYVCNAAKLKKSLNRTLQNVSKRGLLSTQQLYETEFYKTKNGRCILVYEGFLFSFGSQELLSKWLLRMNNVLLNHPQRPILQQFGLSNKTGFLYFDTNLLNTVFANMLKPQYKSTFDSIFTTHQLHGTAQIDFHEGKGNNKIKGGLLPNMTYAATASNRAWTVDIQSRIATSPKTVDLGNQQLIFVQDENGRLHCIDKAGNTLWTKDLVGELLSDFHHKQVDGQHQLFFNTTKTIYKIDETGKELMPAIQLQVLATCSMTVVDFEGVGETYCFVPCENGNVYGYNEGGSPMPAWPKIGIGKVKHPMLHFQEGNKDYLVISGDSTYVYSRFGDTRFPALPITAAKFDFQIHPLSKRITTIDRKGKIHVIPPGTGKSFGVLLPQQQSDAFLFLDVANDGRKDYLNLVGNTLYAYGYASKTAQQLTELWQYPFEQSPDLLSILNTPEAAYIQAFNRDYRRVILMNKNGTLANGFPMTGTQPCNLLATESRFKLLVIPNGAELNAYQVDLQP